jgi:hypothetical protein
MDKLLKLPIGIQTFEKLRKEGYLYVDKTRYLVDLIDNGSVYFLSRPRRFGKSLTVSTFDAIFSGKKELFKGLYAEEFFDRPDYKTHPVIRLDMSDLTTNMGADVLRASILGQVKENARRLGVTIEAAMPGDAFSNLMSRGAEKYGIDIALLIDEYDKPILDCLHDTGKAESAREVLKDFYTRIKAADRYLSFIFITGISKFSRMGVFSALNSLLDISMVKKYAAMLGYTEDELLFYFSGHLDSAAAERGEDREKLLAEIRDYYDGFSFDGETRLYNPFSTLSFFKEPRFYNYWFESGTPEFIARYMKDKKLTVEQFRGIEVPRDFASSPGDIENATAASFLYQSGYLSLRPGRTLDYSLDYPNREVLCAMSSLLTANIFGSVTEANDSHVYLKQSLLEADASGVVAEFNRLLASIPYDDYAAAARKAVGRSGMDAGEWLYRSTLLSYLYGMGFDVGAEPHGSKGRADMVVCLRDRSPLVWVMELKIARGPEATKKAADAAVGQIMEMGYSDPYEEAVLLGLAIDDEQRRITEFRVEMKPNRYPA